MVKTSQNIEVLSRMNNFRKEEKFCDIRLKIDGTEFPAHKNVLAGFSQYFETMFTGEFLEAKEDTVTLECIELGIMESLIEYAYTSEIDLTNDNIQAIFHAANLLQVNPLFEACCDYLKTSLNAENCCGIFNISEVYPCTDLHNSARKFILANFRAVTQEVDYLELEAEKFIDLLKDDSLFVEKEQYIFDATMRWYHYKEEDRKQHLIKALSYVCLSDVDPYFLHSRVKTTRALQSDACRKLFLDALFYRTLPKRRMELSSSLSKLRDSSPFADVLLVSRDTSKTPRNLCVSGNGDVVRAFEIPAQFIASCSSTSDFRLFYVDNSTNVASLFDYERDAWQTTGLSVTWLKKTLRNLDGRWYTFEHGSNKIEVFDEVWKSVPEPSVVIIKNVVSLNGMFYVIGGQTKDNKSSRLVQQFDPHTETWTRTGDLPDCHDSLKTCAFDGRIYVFSESIPSNSESGQWAIEELDVSTGLWSANGNIPEKFRHHKVSSVTVFNESIYVLLVKDTNYTIQVYTPSSNSWRDFPLIPDFDVTMIRCPMRISKKPIESKRGPYSLFNK